VRLRAISQCERAALQSVSGATHRRLSRRAQSMPVVGRRASTRHAARLMERHAASQHDATTTGARATHRAPGAAVTRVLLLHLDGKLPNIALMRVAAHHRDRGDAVTLRRADNWRAVEPTFTDPAVWDHVYASAIFERTRPLAERVRAIYPHAVIGGTGWDVASNLEAIGITTTRQDYGLYPAWRQSIGFTQRGCRLRCAFCVVPRKEGAVREEQTIADLWRGAPWPRELILLDNDFFGQPRWADRIDEIQAGGFRVSFTQGINARMLTDETAAAIARVDYRDDSMRVKRIYTAWDNRKDEARLFAGLDALVRHGVKPDHIMVYMLIGYWPGETHADRDYRRSQLRAFGARPYPMPFVRTPDTVGFQRWVIGAYDKRFPWDAWRAARYQPCNLTAGGAEDLFAETVSSAPAAP
jgi:hypothetical protein